MSKRYLIVAVTALASMLMYIDRVCFSTLIGPIQIDLGLNERERARILGAFFFTYALFQIPIGAMADRYGPRLVLSLSIAAWSLVTAATGLVESFGALLIVRFLLGFTEAGAYPAAAGLVKRWARPDERAKFSSAVALGGRIGGAMAPKLTGWLAVALIGMTVLGTAAGEAGIHWRGVFLVYGVCGVAVAGIFWLVVRDWPPVEASRQPDDGHARPMTTQPAGPPRPFFQQLAVLGRSRRMWFFGGLQFCNNIPWAILITLLPAYLQDRGVAFESVGGIQSQILFVGCIGMFLGGIVSDFVRRKLGQRWGRSVPIATMMTGCALMCLTVSTSPALGIAIAALGLMAMFQDTGLPSVWAFAQDVGGKNVGAALGFGNMLGNFGAALSPILLTEVKMLGGWEAVFAVGATSYLCAACCGLLLDASKPLDPNDA
ncbi:MAG: MFS transporter [Planctomycetes bacterium]|nr:MFS transporter [Planctomycetota bacterium]